MAYTGVHSTRKWLPHVQTGGKVYGATRYRRTSNRRGNLQSIRYRNVKGFKKKQLRGPPHQKKVTNGLTHKVV